VIVIKVSTAADEANHTVTDGIDVGLGLESPMSGTLNAVVINAPAEILHSLG